MDFTHHFFINKREISREHNPYIVAEVACSHDGDINRVKYMIDHVSKSGADAIQFQIFSTERLLTPSHEFYDLVKGLEIGLKDWDVLIDYAINKGLTVIVNPLDDSVVDFAVNAGAHAIKIHSADLSNPRMFLKSISSQLPIILSTGGSTIDEITQALGIILKHTKEVLLMHGFQAYPTKLQDTHLNFISKLRKEFNLNVGYQDHLDSQEMMSKVIPMLAISKGAVLIEKHITDDYSRKGTDHVSAINASEFNEFVRLINDTWASFGSSEKKKLSNDEIKYRRNFKKSIVAARNIEKGEILSEGMLQFMRGESGIPPNEIESIINKKAAKDISQFQNITLELISEG